MLQVTLWIEHPAYGLLSEVPAQNFHPNLRDSWLGLHSYSPGLKALKSDAVVVSINYRLNLSLGEIMLKMAIFRIVGKICLEKQRLVGVKPQALTILRFGFLQPPVAEVVPANRGGRSIYNCDYTDVCEHLVGGDRH